MSFDDPRIQSQLAEEPTVFDVDREIFLERATLRTNGESSLIETQKDRITRNQPSAVASSNTQAETTESPSFKWGCVVFIGLLFLAFTWRYFRKNED